MNRKRWTALIVILVAVIVLAYALLSGRREPQYEGKPLSYWIGSYHEIKRRQLVNARSDSRFLKYVVSNADQAKGKFQEAIRVSGTNAIPLLLAELKYDHHGLLKLLPGYFPKERWSYFDASTECAILGFDVLETNAVSALPELSKLLRNPDHTEVVARIMSGLGPMAFEVMTNALTNSNLQLREWTIEGVGIYCAEVGTSSQALDIMIRALNDPDAEIQMIASARLGGLGDKAVAALPALEKLLNDPNGIMRSNAQEAIDKIKGKGVSK